MANVNLGTDSGVVDKRVGRGVTSADVLAENANLSSVSAMRTRLAALNAGYYTSQRLDDMTENDMLYAIRVLSADSAGI